MHGSTLGTRRRGNFIVLLLMLAGSLPGAAPAVAAPAPVTSYVSLGDSFTAGPLIAVTDPASVGCMRSSSNYPHLLAARLQVTKFQDASCSGAATRHMFGPQTVQGGSNPAQLDSLEATTELVTLQIGGNDIGFGELVTNCAALLPLGTPCQDRYLAGGNDEISDRINRTRPQIDAVLTEIRRRAPAARIFMLGYTSLLPEGSPGCWPFMPYSPEDLPYLIAKQRELNAMLSERAEVNGATFVDTYTPSLGRDACQLPTVRWAEPVVAPLAAAPVHPNAAGMAAMAAQAASAINPPGP